MTTMMLLLVTSCGFDFAAVVFLDPSRHMYLFFFFCRLSTGGVHALVSASRVPTRSPVRMMEYGWERAINGRRDLNWN